MYFVYIMRSLKDGSHYAGLTKDVIKRTNEHGRGKNQSTKAKRPWILIHVEIVEERKEGRKLEKYFKSGFGRETIKEIESNLKTK